MIEMMSNERVEVEDADKAHFRLVEQQLLGKQVTASVSRDAKFPETNDFYAFTFRLNNQTFNLLRIYICNLLLLRRGWLWQF